MVWKTTRQTNTRLAINVNICFITTLRLTHSQYYILLNSIPYKSICFCVHAQNDTNKSGEKSQIMFQTFSIDEISFELIFFLLSFFKLRIKITMVLYCTQAVAVAHQFSFYTTMLEPYAWLLRFYEKCILCYDKKGIGSVNENHFQSLSIWSVKWHPPPPHASPYKPPSLHRHHHRKTCW